MNEKKIYVWIPLIIAVSVAFGFLLNAKFTNESAKNNKIANYSKVDYLLGIINNSYVDSVDVNKIIEDAMPIIVDELDPHSVYIPAKDLAATNEELEGSFSGIGVQFNIQNDTVMVVSVVPGGPSEKIGLMAGDRIVLINDSTFTGKEVTNERVMKTLRGTKDSEVKLGIKRKTAKEILDFNIVRGDIPVNTVDAAYMMGDSIGYVKISKFGRTTYNEFVSSLAKLKSEGAENFIVDLRGNSGGYMDIAINMINEFLPKDKLIVYTEGKSSPRSDAYSNGAGSFQNAPLVVLIDEWSASASEIFAGAIQDNDRGTIIGRRSFGKGLVQQQIPFNDGSALRLTIARYYTPSGRSIQKDYKLGKNSDYSMDIINRYTHGEFYSKDSIKMNDSLLYKTANGRTVYGGGGIMPDIFVPSDTTGSTSYLNSVVNSGALYLFAFKYADVNRDKLIQFKTYEELMSYLASQPLLEDFVTFAETKGIRRRPVYINISKDIIVKQIESYIARNIMGEEAFYKSFFRNDKNISNAVDVIKNNSTFPVTEE
ncbi:MAG: S41 family peptidase [Bacteroidales bacterium]|nr:S41 family peptidase [Bacteroidales bacterium]